MKLKNIIFISLITTTICTTTVFADLGTTNSIPVTSVNKNILDNTFNSYILLDNNTFAESLNLLNIAKSLESVEGMESVDDDYIRLILGLSNDIGTMADRIGIMADRILLMAEEIGVMADRILITQRIQNSNIQMTQTNLSETRDILVSLLNR